MNYSLQQIIFNKAGQEIKFLPLSPPLTSSLPTCTIHDASLSVGSADRIISSGTAVSSSLSSSYLTSNTTPASANADVLILNSTSIFNHGDTVYIIDPGGRSTIREVVEKDGTWLRVQPPLTEPYATGSQVKIAGLTYSFPDDAAALERYVLNDTPLYAIWSFVDKTGKQEIPQQIRVIRKTKNDMLEGEVMKSIQEIYPDMVGKLPNYSEQVFQNIIRNSYRSVKVDLNATSDDHLTMLMGDKSIELLMKRTLLHLASNGISPGAVSHTDFYEMMRKEYDKLLHWIRAGMSGSETIDLPKNTEKAPASNSIKVRAILRGK